MELEFDPSAIERLQVLGGERLVSRMVALFVQNTPDRIAAAQAAHRLEDWSAVERAAHSMKSSAAHLGFRKMHRLAEQIETLAEQGRGPTLAPLLAELSEAYPSVRFHLLTVAARTALGA